MRFYQLLQVQSRFNKVSQTNMLHKVMKLRGTHFSHRLIGFSQHLGGADPELALAVADKTKLMLHASTNITNFKNPGCQQPTPKDALSDLVAYGKIVTTWDTSAILVPSF